MSACIVIGAGPAGLASAAMLAEAGVESVVLERGPGVAAKWRAGYDRLQINTSAWFSHLPGARLPRRMGQWPSRDDLVAYYERYAADRRLQVVPDTEVTRIDRVPGGWQLSTPRGPRRARAVVVATSKDHSPLIPEWPGRAEFRGQLLHASSYRNAARFRGAAAMVVGAGNSAMDIALDLAEGGASAVSLAIRTPPNLFRRAILGVPSDLFAVALQPLPDSPVDAMSKRLRRLTFGDLSGYGLPIPSEGPRARLRRKGMIPIIDHGPFVTAVKQRKFEITAGVESLHRDGVRLLDGSERHADAVIAATGYGSGLELLVGHLGILDERGRPLAHGAATHHLAPSLHFIGFTDPLSGNLRQIRLDSRRIARAIADAGA